MKNTLTLVLILFLVAACSEEVFEEYSGHMDEIFPEITRSEELNLYMDDTGEPAEGSYSATYGDGSPLADITFYRGMISEGAAFAHNGERRIGYSTKNGMMKVTYYTAEGDPRMITVFGDDLKDQREFHVWSENGDRLVKSDETMLKMWFENGQERMVSYTEDGKIHGRIATWYESGQLEQEGHYVHGEKDGTFTTWDEDGNVTGKEVYEMGKLVSEQ